MSRFENMVVESIKSHEIIQGDAPLFGVFHRLTTKNVSGDISRKGAILQKHVGIEFKGDRVARSGEDMIIHHANIPKTPHALVVLHHDDGTHTYGIMHNARGLDNEGSTHFVGVHRSAHSPTLMHENLKRLYNAGPEGVAMTHSLIKDVE